jgi:hypothetical protein
LLCITISPIVARSQSVITTYAGGSPIQLSSSLSITQIGIGSPASVLSDGDGGFYFTTSQKIYRAAAGGPRNGADPSSKQHGILYAISIRVAVAAG